MKSRRGNSNTAGESGTAVIEQNPYLQRTTDEGERDQETETLARGAEDEESAAVEPADERRKAKQRRRRLALAALGVLLLAGIGCALALYYRRSTRVEYGQTAKQSRVASPTPNGATTTGRDTRVEQAIEEAQRLTGRSGQTISSPSPATASSRGATQGVANDPAHHSRTDDAPFNVPTDFGATVKGKPDTQAAKANTDTNNFNERASEGSTANASTGDRRTIRSQRSSESSLYTNERADKNGKTNVGLSVRENRKVQPNHESKMVPTVVLPSFGSMLPVRTIGGLYTLRTGALTRLELTRDINGDGWAMKRGTILVGTTKGGEYDRAYVSVVGFIDPQSGKLVKLSGDVRGGDGAAGLKGKRRQIDGGWARVLGQVGSAALNLTGALIGGRGNGTVIISDGARTRAVNPVTDEISGMIGGEVDRKQRQGFVDVEAGTPGYVMVTDLPAVLKGTEAKPELDEGSLALLTDVDAVRPATGLSEHELAELLATGSPAEIKAALPRMSPEMRKIAEALLSQ